MPDNSLSDRLIEVFLKARNLERCMESVEQDRDSLRHQLDGGCPKCAKAAGEDTVHYEEAAKSASCQFCAGTGMIATEEGGAACVCKEPLLSVSLPNSLGPAPLTISRFRVQWNTAARRLQETGDRTGRARGVLLEERLRAHPVSAGTCETLLLNADLAERVHAALDE